MKIPTKSAYKSLQRKIHIRQAGYDQISPKGYYQLVSKENRLKKKVAARNFKPLGKPFTSRKQWNTFIKNIWHKDR